MFGNASFSCLLYTSDAADEEDSVDLGGRRIIKKKYFNRLAENRKMRVINLDSPHTKLASKVSGKQMWISDNADLQQ